MSDPKNDVMFFLKVMVNKEKTKVLFAEIDSNFADVLLSFLTLSLGTIVRILKKHYGDEAPVFGSLSSLYNGLVNLDNVHFWTEGAKSILVDPRSSSDAQRRSLMLDISNSQQLEYFCCSYMPNSHKFQNVSMYPDSVSKCIYYSCDKKMMLVSELAQASPCGDGVFTTTTSSFVINDDLQILSTTTGLLPIASSFSIADMDKAEQMTASFGYSEVMDLLKASLISSTPLSDVILNKTGQLRKCEQGTLLKQIDEETTSNSKKMTLRVMVQKSNNKLLYAQAEEDFAEYLFCILIIPLGGVECLLAGNSSFKCLDNLYRSVADHIDNKYFKTPDAKNRLIKPKIPHGYLPLNNKVLPLIEEELPSFCGPISFSSLKFPKGKGIYLKEPKTFMVTDDLTVTPHSIASVVSFLKKMKVSVSDVKEVELQVGLKEALGILRASLTSTCALSNGLNLTNHLSSLKQPKQEH